MTADTKGGCFEVGHSLRPHRIAPPVSSSISDARTINLRCYTGVMRTTVRLDPEVVAAAEQLRRTRHIGLGEAVNELARAGLTLKHTPTHFQQRTAEVGLKVDATNIADALELLDQLDAEDAR